MIRIVKKISSAIQLRDKKSISNLLLSYNANNIIINDAKIIKPSEADFKPFSTSKTYTDFWCVWKNLYKANEIIIPQNIQPVVAANAPIISPTWSPTNVDVLTANSPGVICEIVMMSVNIFSLIQRRFVKDFLIIFTKNLQSSIFPHESTKFSHFMLYW